MLQRLETTMGQNTLVFKDLWTQMHGRLCGFVCSRVSNPEDAQDLLQDIFVRIYQQRETVQEVDRLESWMYQIARHRVIDYYRSRRAWVDLPETLMSEETPDSAATEDLVPFIQKAVQSLPEPYREALILTDFQGLGQQELANQTSISLPGAKSRVQRARQKVKEALLHCFQFEFDLRGAILDYRRTCCC